MDPENGLSAKHARLTWLRSRIRREGSLAAALVQSMTLAVIGTAGAYPSWVLVKSAKRDIVLGASWAVTRIDPEPNSPLLGSAGGPIMFAIAYCCLLSVATGSLALTMDFLGRRRGRSWAPLLHGVTAVLVASSSAGGSCLLALVRGRVRSDPELVEAELSTSPGQSLFLSFLACVLAATATGLSCSSPARVQPARSSWDLGRVVRRAEPRFPAPAAAEEEEEGSTPSLDSLTWRDGRLSSLLLDSPQEDSRRARWYDYTAPELRVALDSRHSLLRSEIRAPGSLYEELSRRDSALSVEVRYPLVTPAPSMVTLQPEDSATPSPSSEEGTPVQEDAEGAPGPAPEPEPEPERLPPPDRRESLTWRDAVVSEEEAEPKPEPTPEPRGAEPGSEGPVLPAEQQEARV